MPRTRDTPDTLPVEPLIHTNRDRDRDRNRDRGMHRHRHRYRRRSRSRHRHRHRHRHSDICKLNDISIYRECVRKKEILHATRDIARHKVQT